MEQSPLRPDRTYRDEIVRIAELTVNTYVLDRLTFTNCRIVGPAVLAILDNNTFAHCGWDAPDLDALFWEVPASRLVVMGAVGVRDCTFSNCKFEGVGVAGNAQLRAQFGAGLND